MKPSITILLLMSALASHATSRMVSNDINNPAQYNNVQAAITASVNGDTVYVNPTAVTYADFTINKRLVMIGGGYSSPNQFNFTTVVNTIFLLKTAGINDASGSVIMGFRVNGIGYSGSSLIVSNIKLFRNFIVTIDASPIGATNWLIYNNIIAGGVQGRNLCSLIIIQNNIFTSGGFLNQFIQSSILIDHNLFINNNPPALNAMQFAVVTNNIFTSTAGTAVINNNTTQNTFNNNLSMSTNIGPNAPTNSFLGGPNTGGGNLVGTDPLFVNVTNFNAYDANANYRLTTGSPGRNGATDGSDLGIYGGSYPFPSGGAPGSGYDTSPLPPIPQINAVNIQNATLQPGTLLKVTVQAKITN